MMVYFNCGLVALVLLTTGPIQLIALVCLLASFTYHILKIGD